MKTNDENEKTFEKEVDALRSRSTELKLKPHESDRDSWALHIQTIADIARATTTTINLSALLSTTVELIQKRFTLCYVAVFFVDDALEYAQLEAGSGEEGRKILEGDYKIALGESSPMHRCIIDRQAQSISHKGDAWKPVPPYILPQTRFEILLPMASRNHIIGVLSIQSDQRSAFLSEDLPVFQTIADQVSNAIENTRLIERIQFKRDLLNVLMDNIPDAIYFKDMQSRFLRVSRAKAKKMGCTDPEELIGKTDFDFFTKEHSRQAFDDEQKVIYTNQPMIDIEEKETWPDSHVTWVSTTKMPLRDKNDTVIGTFGVSRDITKRKIAEEKLSFRLEFEKHITSISTKFINLDSHKIDNEIRNSLQVIGDFTHADRGYVILFEYKGNALARTHEWCTLGIKSQMQQFTAMQPDLFTWLLERIRCFETIHFNSLEDLPKAAHTEKQWFTRHGVRSLINVPLVYGGRSRGIIGIEKLREEKRWSDDTITLLKIVGEIFMNALARKRAEEELQKANNLLEIRVEERTADFKKANELLEKHIAQLSFLDTAFYELSQIILLDKLLPAILNVFLSHFPEAHGTLSIHTGEGFQCTHATGVLDSEQGRTCSEHALKPYLRVDLARPVCIEDWTTHSRINCCSWPALGSLRCYVAIPLLVDNSCRAILQIFTVSVYAQQYSQEHTFLTTLSAHASICLSNALHYQELGEKYRLDGELDAARGIQRRFTPQYKPDIPHVNLQGVYYPAYEVGGDYLDYFQTEAGNWVVVVADVCGKGIPSALLMVMLRSTFRFEARKETSARKLLCAVNEFMTINLDEKSFVTALCLIINKEGTTMSYARAGHPLLLKIGNHETTPARIECGGIALGMIREQEKFQAVMEEINLSLEPGDRYLIYTDGLIEASDNQRNIYGSERLNRVLTEQCTADTGPDALIKLLMDDIKVFTREAPYHDDLTILALQVK